MTHHGCVLVGDRILGEKLLNSATAYQRLYDFLYNTLKTEKVFINIEDIPEPIVVETKEPIIIEIKEPIIIPEIKQTLLQKIINIILKWIRTL